MKQNTKIKTVEMYRHKYINSYRNKVTFGICERTGMIWTVISDVLHDFAEYLLAGVINGAVFEE